MGRARLSTLRIDSAAGVLELAYRPGLGPGARKSLGVRIPPPALSRSRRVALRLRSLPGLNPRVRSQEEGAVAQLVVAPVSKTGGPRFESWLPRYDHAGRAVGNTISSKD